MSTRRSSAKNAIHAVIYLRITACYVRFYQIRKTALRDEADHERADLTIVNCQKEERDKNFAFMHFATSVVLYKKIICQNLFQTS
jgi:hypothetical protein